MNKLKVLIDITPLYMQPTGIYHYTKNLIDAIKKAENSPELFYYTYNKIFKCYKDIENLTLNYKGNKRNNVVRMINSTVEIFGMPGQIFHAALYNTYHNYFLKKVVKNGVEKYQPDIVHGINSLVPDIDKLCILTIFDISCFRYPETHPSYRVKRQQKILPESIKKADHIITISQFSKDEIIDYFGVKPENITVAYCGIGSEYKPRSEKDLSDVLLKYSLSFGKYILTVSTLEPRKNIETLIRAHSNLPSDFQKEYPLVIVGMRGWKEASILKLIKSKLKHATIKILGYVDQNDLPDIYSGAFIFAYPSIYEGFGMPPVEAMASNVPVIVSDRASLPEVINDAGIIVNAMDTQAWSDAIKLLIDDKSRYSILQDRGIKRAAYFTWEKTAQSTIMAYNKILSAQS